jgi:hypothetical protein
VRGKQSTKKVDHKKTSDDEQDTDKDAYDIDHAAGTDLFAAGTG